MHEYFRMILNEVLQIFMLIKMTKKFFENSHFWGSYPNSTFYFHRFLGSRIVEKFEKFQ